MEGDGFTVVKRRGRYVKNKPTPTCHMTAVASDNDEDVDKSSIVDKINVCKHDIQISEFYGKLQGQLHGMLSKAACSSIQKVENICSESVCRADDIEELVCYGVGHFTSCLIARYQLALLLLLRENLKIPFGKSYVFDPVFSSAEIGILQEYNLTVIKENEEGKRSTTGLTLFYLPHCGKALYNNLLWANWNPEKLSNIVLLGNSFHNMHDSTPERMLQSQASYILNILPCTSESPVENNFHYPDIFNDMSIHVFQKTSLEPLPSSFWSSREEPTYDGQDLEIVLSTNKVTSS